MNTIEAFLVHAFTKQGSGGNPAGVVLNADSLSDEDKRRIAKIVGFSETAFVSKDTTADFAVDFFTTTDEVDFCGHATVATFSTLFEKGHLEAGNYTQKTKAGILNVCIEPNGRIIMDQALPSFLETFSHDLIAPLIGIDSTLLASTNLPLQVISTGLKDLIVPVPYGYLDKLIINEQQLTKFSQTHQIVGIHAFEYKEQPESLSVSCRNFAPLFGIPEESATGSACGALACYLTKYLTDLESHHFLFEQGRAMHCASHISAKVEHHQNMISRVLVGGYARQAGSRLIEL